jgi:ANTAR domain/PAS fold
MLGPADRYCSGMPGQGSPDDGQPAEFNGAATADHPPNSGGEPIGPVDQALLGGAPQRVGRFEYRYDSDTWTWSETVAVMHGYEPGHTQPSTEQVLSHKHPEDLTNVKGLLLQSAAPFSSRHRIYTTTGELRNVVVVGDAVTDDDGRIVATRGFYVDVTESLHNDLERSVSEKLHQIVAHREIIEQAKGMLMMIYHIDADAAFGILRWRSQELNLKLGLIAGKIVAELPGVIEASDPAVRLPVDHYLMTLGSPDADSV